MIGGQGLALGILRFSALALVRCSDTLAPPVRQMLGWRETGLIRVTRFCDRGDQKMIKSIYGVVFFLGLFFLSGLAHAAGSDYAVAAFNAGNSYYAKGDYENAINEYEKAASGTHVSASVYFNLGNAYYKAGKPGRALLNYQRAERLAPRDADIEANIRFIRTRIKSEPPQRSGIWQWKPLRDYCRSFTVNGLLWISSALFMLALAFFLLSSYRNSWSVRFKAAAALVLVCFVFNVYVSLHEIQKAGTRGVVVVPDAEVRYGPYDSATSYFKVYEAMGVSVLNKKDGWYKIRRPDGKIGWVKVESVEII